MSFNPKKMILEKEINFILSLDALKNVQRRNYNYNDKRRENAAEHSWQIIVLAQIFYPYAKNKEKIDLLRVIKMLSIHDVVEIDAGDTFVYDEEAITGKYERELAAAERIFGLLPSSLSEEFLNLWKEFEAAETDDAIFACAVDRIMPFILNAHTSGKSWKQVGITESQARNIIEKAVKKASDAMGEAFETLLKRAIDSKKLLPASQ